MDSFVIGVKLMGRVQPLTFPTEEMARRMWDHFVAEDIPVEGIYRMVST